MRESDLNEALSVVCRRDEKSNKGTHGTLLAFCGSAMYRGAAVIAALGALRSGVGILRLVCVEKVASAVAAALPEATFLPLGDIDNISLACEDVKKLLCEYRNTAVLCGCGMGNNAQTLDVVRALLDSADVPLILDADALNVIARDGGIPNVKGAPLTVTPHVGEFARLAKMSIDAVKADPEGAAADYSRTRDCVTVLKDHKTVIASPDGRIYTSHFGNSGLAKGGSGDLLAGMTAALNARGIPAFEAAKYAVILHGAAADRCALRMSKTAMLAHDVANELCLLFAEYENNAAANNNRRSKNKRRHSKMKHSYRTRNTCSMQIDLELDGNILHNVTFMGGCNGNTKAISKLVEGKDAREIASVLAGNTCGMRDTSCADQLSKAILKALEDEANANG